MYLVASVRLSVRLSPLSRLNRLTYDLSSVGVCGYNCADAVDRLLILDHFGIPFGSQPIKSALARHSGVQVPVIPIKIGTFHILPMGLHGLCFGWCFAGPLPLRSMSRGPFSRVHFGESLVVRLY